MTYCRKKLWPCRILPLMQKVFKEQGFFAEYCPRIFRIFIELLFKVRTEKQSFVHLNAKTYFIFDIKCFSLYKILAGIYFHIDHKLVHIVIWSKYFCMLWFFQKFVHLLSIIVCFENSVLFLTKTISCIWIQILI